MAPPDCACHGGEACIGCRNFNVSSILSVVSRALHWLMD